MNKIVFMHRKGAQGLGSVYLRGNQVSDFLRLEGFECTVVPQGAPVI